MRWETVVGDLISEAQLGPRPELFRTNVLEHARRLIAFDTAIFLPVANEAPGTYNKVPGHAAIYQLYRERQHVYGQELKRTLGAASYIDTELFSGPERHKMAFFNEILAPQHICSRIVAHVRFRGQVTATLQLCRHDGGRFFRREELAALTHLVPAISLAHTALAARPTDTCDVLAEQSPRERQIVEYVRHGYRNKEIAVLLGTSPLTVRNQLSRIYQRLGVATRAELAAWAERAKRSI